MMTAKQIKKERQARGWSQRELADMAGYTRSLIGKVETGQTANGRALERISRVFLEPKRGKR